MFWASVIWRRGCRIGGMSKTPHSRGKNEGDGNGSHLKEQPLEGFGPGSLITVRYAAPSNLLQRAAWQKSKRRAHHYYLSVVFPDQV
ncbi:hypothetical protein [Cupriavidus sp. TKC]|uniref:hypothetical protein n=1 Tax=Cupriavidus sp. TKC TaxID=2880159 RepID=UPI00295E9392|nr:hypothetical protein [Cupriavidus sp. TKC]